MVDTVMAPEVDILPENLSEEEISQLKADFEELGVSSAEEKPAEEKPAEEKPAEDEDALGPEHDDKTEEEREAIRERRRKERQQKKEFRREKEDSYKREIEGLRKQLAEVNEWKNTVERRNVNSGIAQLDKAIKDSVEAFELSKRALKEAMDTNNGEAAVEAQELYYAARKRIEDLSKVKQQVSQKMQQPAKQNIDPVMVQMAQGWMSDKTWYDPQGKDADSRIALTVDNTMAEEGWDPRTPEYWTELDSRLKKYLPHRYGVSYNEPNTSTRSERRPPTGSSTPTVSTKPTEYRLSPDRVRAMKEAGIWDDPDRRKAMIKRYMEQDKQLKA